MGKRISVSALIPVYIVVLLGCILIAQAGSDVVTTVVENAPVERQVCFVIDAGHGGIDSGATSCSGIQESHLNLQISMRLNDLLCFLGYDTLMIRDRDTSIYTEGDTIAAQKVSDLKNRVNIVNETENSILLSIHQNTYTDGRYSGAQVFYRNDESSKAIAQELQTALIRTLDPSSKRRSRSADGIYLMQHIENPGVLIECGFISNHEEEAKLRDAAYQKKLVCVIAATLSTYMNEDPLRA